MTFFKRSASDPGGEMCSQPEEGWRGLLPPARTWAGIALFSAHKLPGVLFAKTVVVTPISVIHQNCWIGG